MSIKILHLFHDLMNLYGDYGNVVMLQKRLAELGMDVSVDSISADTTFESLGVDSLDTVEMVMDLEDELGVELDLEDKIATVGELVAFIETKL